MNRKNLHFLLCFSIVFLNQCNKIEKFEGSVGYYYTISAEGPSMSPNMTFNWSLINLPSTSSLTIDSLILLDDNTNLSFLPDIPGIYQFSLVGFSEQDKIIRQNFSFNVFPHEMVESPNYEAMSSNTTDISSDIAGEDVKYSTTIEENSIEEKIGIAESRVSIEDGPSTTSPKILQQETENPEDYFAQKSIKAIKIEKKAEPETKKRKLTIQVSSWETLEEAQNELTNLTIHGLDAYLQTYKDDYGITWYRIRVGSFNTYQNAKSAAKAVENITQKPSWIDTIHN